MASPVDDVRNFPAKKPEKVKKIYLIDFGLAKQYKVSQTRYLKFFNQFNESYRWEVKLDEQSKQIYYIDYKNKKSQWNQPYNLFEIIKDIRKTTFNPSLPDDPVPASAGVYHIPFREDKNLVGTRNFCSINANAGREQGRKDDLEGLAYTLIYLAKGKLPWMDYPGIAGHTQKERLEEILRIKETTSTETLCAGLPDAVSEYLNYCKSLKFDECPNYAKMIAMFQPLLKNIDRCSLWPNYD